MWNILVILIILVLLYSITRAIAQIYIGIQYLTIELKDLKSVIQTYVTLTFPPKENPEDYYRKKRRKKLLDKIAEGMIDE